LNPAGVTKYRLDDSSRYFLSYGVHASSEMSTCPQQAQQYTVYQLFNIDICPHHDAPPKPFPG